MKSKATTYLLVVAVIAVWGVIAWKALSSGTDGAPAPQARPAAQLQAKQADTLLLNYRDPFLKGRRVAAAEPPVATLLPLPQTVAVKKPAKHNVRYIGRIGRKGVEYCLADINNVQYTLRAGDTVDGYRLKTIFADSVHFDFEGERCCIKLVQ